MGWVAGKAHQLAVAEPLTRDEQLSLLLQAESMALGIEGKLALWEALLAVAPEYPQPVSYTHLTLPTTPYV